MTLLKTILLSSLLAISPVMGMEQQKPEELFSWQKEGELTTRQIMENFGFSEVKNIKGICELKVLSGEEISWILNHDKIARHSYRVVKGTGPKVIYNQEVGLHQKVEGQPDRTVKNQCYYTPVIYTDIREMYLYLAKAVNYDTSALINKLEDLKINVIGRFIFNMDRPASIEPKNKQNPQYDQQLISNFWAESKDTLDKLKDKLSTAILKDSETQTDDVVILNKDWEEKFKFDLISSINDILSKNL